MVVVVASMDIQSSQQCNSAEGHHQRSSWYDQAAAMAAASFPSSDMTDNYFKGSSYYGSYGKPDYDALHLLLNFVVFTN